ncbi:hypothetical protein DPMN_090167 [Dreissena polymorpha]|uniref:Uncharacterized protein n=1 Tax=Dreissena polymorpha TaxID=45954 RepID=A0A9D4KX85_DREPO|nr:hypothetical protein DPMN_090167 [Dreissena polymorpha]
MLDLISDATLQEKAMNLIRNLQHLEGKIKIGESQKDVHPDQNLIQRLFDQQMKLQEEFLHKQSETKKVTKETNVKTPKA